MELREAMAATVAALRAKAAKREEQANEREALRLRQADALKPYTDAINRCRRAEMKIRYTLAKAAAQEAAEAPDDGQDR